ncbi:MAG: nuclear transport factor 2 family protein [Pseudomonadota bacterium]|nr:nuclear transport factor 2 family protein [Pseudomonadota bacterium]
MSESIADVLRTIYRAWEKGDMATLEKHLAEDICHNVHVAPQVHPLGGIREGREQVLARLKQIDSQFTSLNFSPGELLMKGNQAAAQVRIARMHRISDVQYRTTLAHYWTFRDGLAARLDEYHDMGDLLEFAERSVVRV